MKIVYYCGASRRAQILGQAVLAGLKRHGHAAEVIDEGNYVAPDADIAVFYGLAGKLKRAQQEYVAAGRKAVFLDLGYWGREEDADGGLGTHRVVVNALHATGYFQRRRHPADRFKRFGIHPRPFAKRGTRVLLCGMSAKAAWVYDCKPEAWERGAVESLRSSTQRLIQYRPKPSWKDARPIPGAAWVKPGVMEIGEALRGAWACVTHHSNAALDALIAGVPVFCVDGIAAPLAHRSLGDIERPLYPDEGERDQLLYDAAHTQFSVSEIADGTMWRYLRDEELL